MARQPHQSIKPCAQDVNKHAIDIYKGSLAVGRSRGQTRCSNQVFKKPCQSIKLCARQKASNTHNYEWHVKTVHHQISYEGSLKGKLERANSNFKPHEAFNYYVEEPRQSIKVCGHKKHMSIRNYIWHKKACHEQIQGPSHKGKL